MIIDKLAAKFHGKHLLITGGAGFIGSHVAERLMDDCKITLYDNLRRNSVSVKRLPKNVRLIKGDVLDLANLKTAVKNVDIVFHLAAVAGINTVTKSPITTMKINLIGTYNLFQAIEDANPKIERVVLTSTSEVIWEILILGQRERSDIARTSQRASVVLCNEQTGSRALSTQLLSGIILNSNLPKKPL